MGAIRRAGYWSVDIRAGIGFSAFSAYYLGLNLIGMYLVAMTWLRSKIPLERKRLRIFVIVHAISLFGGFMTDTILFSLGIDFPKVGVLWAGIWAVGVNVAMERYAFLAPFSPRVMGLLMDRFIERSLDGIMVSDAAGRIIYWNAPLVELTGIHSDEAIGSSMDSIQAKLTPPDARQGSMPDRITDAMKQHPDAPGHLVELEILARDGQIRWLQTSVFTIPTDSGDIWAFILRDSTDQKRIAALTIERMQRQSHAQKMEALGSLAGGIAHDFNNTLGGILGAVSLIRACLDDGDGSQPIDFSRELEVIYQSSQRAASSVRGLMAFTVDTPQKKGAIPAGRIGQARSRAGIQDHGSVGQGAPGRSADRRADRRRRATDRAADPEPGHQRRPLDDDHAAHRRGERRHDHPVALPRGSGRKRR